MKPMVKILNFVELGSMHFPIPESIHVIRTSIQLLKTDLPNEIGTLTSLSRYLIRDDIKSSSKFAIFTRLKIEGREGVQRRTMEKYL